MAALVFLLDASLVLIAAAIFVFIFLSWARATSPSPPKEKHYHKLRREEDVAQYDASSDTVTLRCDCSKVGVIVCEGQDSPSVINLRLRVGTQHTLQWDSKLGCAMTPEEEVTETLPAGECNLYQFPLVSFANDPGHVKPTAVSGVRLEILRRVVLAVCAKLPDAADMVDIGLLQDPVGAAPIHGLLIANSNAAADLVLDIVTMRPELAACVHGEGPFRGENALHVLAVNRRQNDAIRLLDIAVKHLDDDLLGVLLNSFAEGAFFTRDPMRSYGGSPLAYLASFRAAYVIDHIMATPRLSALVDLNSPQTCPLSGYLPIHAAVANGRADMFDLLVQLGADPLRLTQSSNLGFACDNRGYTALQLACRLGNKVMVEHILRSRWETDWKWGPVTQYRLSLADIDSTGNVNGVMDLIPQGGVGMPRAAQELLLDDFMEGFLHSLFMEKWERFGKRQYVYARMLDVLSLCLAIGLGLALKESPLTASRNVLPYAAATAAAVQLMYDALQISLWQQAHDGESPGSQLWRRLSVRILSVLSALSITWRPHTPTADGDGDEIAWALLSVTVFLQFNVLISITFVPYQSMGIFALVIDKLLRRDVRIFLAYFFMYLLCFWTVMYINYPRAGSGELAIVPEFNNMFDSFEAMLNLVMAGGKLSIDFSSESVYRIDDTDESNLWGRHAKFFNLVIFTCFFYICMMLLVILLLRLLMAMLSATFTQTRLAATLEWRVQFARYMLEIELVAGWLGQDTNGGEPVDHANGEGPKVWSWTFRQYDADNDASAADPRGTHAPQSSAVNDSTVSAAAQKVDGAGNVVYQQADTQGGSKPGSEEARAQFPGQRVPSTNAAQAQPSTSATCAPSIKVTLPLSASGLGDTPASMNKSTSPQAVTVATEHAPSTRTPIVTPPKRSSTEAPSTRGESESRAALLSQRRLQRAQERSSQRSPPPGERAVQRSPPPAEVTAQRSPPPGEREKAGTKAGPRPTPRSAAKSTPRSIAKSTPRTAPNAPGQPSQAEQRYSA